VSGLSVILGGVLPVLAGSLAGAQPPVEVRGVGPIFAARGVAIFWGVVLGRDEESTQVVLRIERLDPMSRWRLVSVEALDPPAGRREWIGLALGLDEGLLPTVEMPREGFIARPGRRILFYPDAPALQAGRPGLVVTYDGIPDGVPEFRARGDLAEYFGRARERARP